jgi:hypothetical protein
LLVFERRKDFWFFSQCSPRFLSLSFRQRVNVYRRDSGILWLTFGRGWVVSWSSSATLVQSLRTFAPLLCELLPRCYANFCPVVMRTFAPLLCELLPCSAHFLLSMKCCHRHANLLTNSGRVIHFKDHRFTMLK